MLFLGLLLIASFGYYYSSKSAYYERNSVKSGYVVLGFESHEFVPCNGYEEWWLTDDSVTLLFENYRALTSRDYQPIFVKVRGEASSKGSYGHGGGSDRLFSIVEVLEASTEKKKDCELNGMWSSYL